MKDFHDLIYQFSVLNQNLALQVREGSLRKRERTTPQFRSVRQKIVNIDKNLYVRVFLAPPNISICAFLHLFHSHIFILICWKACDLPDQRQFNGNCLQMKNLELPDCHSATPSIPPTSNGPLSISVQKYFTAISHCSTLLDIKLIPKSTEFYCSTKKSIMPQSF